MPVRFRTFAGQTLPVYLSDNHAETFGWITRTFDLDAPHVLDIQGRSSTN